MGGSVELSAEVYEALRKVAEAAGCSIAQWIAAQVNKALEEGRGEGGPEKTLQELTAQQEELRKQLRDSYKNRAIIYWFIYDELRERLGAEEAEALMGRAIYRRGVVKGMQKYSQFAPLDLRGLGQAFLNQLADQGRLFLPEVLRADSEALDIKFQACPLREAWEEAGLGEEEIATLCRIASQVDYGTFQGAGFGFWADTWQAGGEGCCFLHIRPGSAPASEKPAE